MFGSCVGSNIIQRDRTCLFCAFSYCIYNTEDIYSEIWLSTVNKVINGWEYCKDFIIDLSMVKSTEDYKNLSSKDEEYSGSIELTCNCH